MKFIGTEPFVKQLRADKGFRVEINVAQDQYEAIKDLPNLQGKVLEINVLEVNDQNINPQENQ